MERHVSQAHAWLERQPLFYNHLKLQLSCNLAEDFDPSGLGGFSPNNSARLLCLRSFQLFARHAVFWDQEVNNTSNADIDVWVRNDQVLNVSTLSLDLTNTWHRDRRALGPHMTRLG